MAKKKAKTPTIINPSTSFTTPGYASHLNDLFNNLTKNYTREQKEYLAQLLAWEDNQDLYDFFEPSSIHITQALENDYYLITFTKLNDPECEPLTKDTYNNYLSGSFALSRVNDFDAIESPLYNPNDLLNNQTFTVIHINCTE